MNEVMLRNNRYKAEQSVEKARARVQEAAHAIWDARYFTKGYKAERVQETVQVAYFAGYGRRLAGVHQWGARRFRE
jgi:hypothetical protein